MTLFPDGVPEVCRLNWHIVPFRTDRWYEAWHPAAARCLSYGASSWNMTRSIADPLAFCQAMVFEKRSDFERYWYADEIAKARESVIDLYDKPLLPDWHQLLDTQ